MTTSRLDHQLEALNDAILRQDAAKVLERLTQDTGPFLNDKHLHGYDIGFRSGDAAGLTSPLSVAAQAGLLPMVKLLLAQGVDPGVADLGLAAALTAAQWDSLRLIWPHGSGEARAEILTATLQRCVAPSPRWHALLDDWATELDAATFKGEKSVVSPHLQTALAQTAGLGHLPLLRALIPLTSPALRQSLALRAAVEQGHDEAVRLLLPHSNIQAARHAWLFRTRPQWDAVDRLSVHLSPEQRQKWGRDVSKMPRLAAIQRCEASELTPPKPSTRRRRRS